MITLKNRADLKILAPNPNTHLLLTNDLETQITETKEEKQQSDLREAVYECLVILYLYYRYQVKTHLLAAKKDAPNTQKSQLIADRAQPLGILLSSLIAGIRFKLQKLKGVENIAEKLEHEKIKLTEEAALYESEPYQTLVQILAIDSTTLKLKDWETKFDKVLKSVYTDKDLQNIFKKSSKDQIVILDNAQEKAIVFSAN